MTTDSRDQALAKAIEALKEIIDPTPGKELISFRHSAQRKAAEALAAIDALASAPPQPTTMRTVEEIRAEIERIQNLPYRGIGDKMRLSALSWVLSADKKETGR